MRTELVSIVVPVYNANSYIEQCVTSICKQSYTAFELILINDGSTDESPRICDQWAQKDERICIIHQSNEGVSAARNKGLKQAAGQWVVFIDADDWIEPTYLEDLVSEAADLVVSGYTEVGEGRKRTVARPSGFCGSREHIASFIAEKALLSQVFSPWGKLFRTEILKEHKIQFDMQTSLGEDTLFVYSYLAHINSNRVIKSVAYCYRVGIGLCTSFFSSEMYIYTKTKILMKLENLFELSLVTYADKQKMSSYFNMYFGSQSLRAIYSLAYSVREKKMLLQDLTNNYTAWNKRVKQLYEMFNVWPELALLYAYTLYQVNRLK